MDFSFTIVIMITKYYYCFIKGKFKNYLHYDFIIKIINQSYFKEVLN